jgi:hypothetical protein
MSHPLPRRTLVSDTVHAPHRLSLGLVLLPDQAPWLELDEDLPSDLLEKRRLLQEQRDQVFVELPSSRPAQREVLERVTESLLHEHPGLYSRSGPHLELRFSGQRLDLEDARVPPLELSAQCVQEDLCVMEKREGDWCLTAAAVCFPTRWDLPSKLGLPMTEVHEPVPDYREVLGQSAKLFFDGMKPKGVFRRGNWSLLDDAALFQPVRQLRSRADPALSEHNAGESLWLRVEHQTLQRLPRTGAVLFGIRVHRTRLDEAAADPAAAATLLDAIRSMAPQMQRYKSIPYIRDAALAYLERRVQS